MPKIPAGPSELSISWRIRSCTLGEANAGALLIETGFWGILCHNYNKESPQKLYWHLLFIGPHIASISDLGLQAPHRPDPAVHEKRRNLCHTHQGYCYIHTYTDLLMHLVQYRFYTGEFIYIYIHMYIYIYVHPLGDSSSSFLLATASRRSRDLIFP